MFGLKKIRFWTSVCSEQHKKKQLDWPPNCDHLQYTSLSSEIFEQTSDIESKFSWNFKDYNGKLKIQKKSIWGRQGY